MWPKRLRERFAAIPDLDARVTRPVLFSFRTPIEVEVHGDDLVDLRRRAEGVKSTLAAMPQLRELGGGHLLRPLLDVSRAQLEDYAQAQGLRWIEDPSNAETNLDRNYLRREVMPLLQRRWPARPARSSLTW